MLRQSLELEIIQPELARLGEEDAKLALYTTTGLMAKPDAVRAQVFTKATQDNDQVLTRQEFERFLGVLFGQVVGWSRSSQPTP